MTRFRFHLKGGYVIGALTIPTDVGAIHVATVGGTKADALMRAATIAQRIAEDPVMAALMPPQAAAAIDAAKALSKAARQGPKALKRLWGRIRGPGKKRLAEALAKEAAETAGLGAVYFGERSSVRQPNRGAWQEWLDYDHEYVDPDEYADDVDYEIGRGRRKRRRRGGRRMRDRERERDGDDDAPLDEPAAPIDDQQPAYDDAQQPEYDEGGES